MPIWRLKSLINKEFEKNSNLYINSRHLLHLVELKTAEMRFFCCLGHDCGCKIFVNELTIRTGTHIIKIVTGTCCKKAI